MIDQAQVSLAKKVTYPRPKNLDPWYRFERAIAALGSLNRSPDSSTWLDVGCNQGQFLELISERYSVHPTGIDNWDPKHLDSDFEYFQRDIAKGFELDAEFDYISAMEVLEHMIDTDHFLAECYSHLKPGGYLIITTPNINSLRNRVGVPLGKYPIGLEFKNEIHHVRLYNKPTLISHLSEHGFTVRRCVGVSFMPSSLLTVGILDRASQVVSNLFPQFCNNLIVICQK